MSVVLFVALAICQMWTEPYVRCIVGGLSHMSDVLSVGLAICQIRWA
jgi:hypothetical protein